MNTKKKGNIALSRAIAYFIKEGYSVFLPLADDGGHIDLLITKDGYNILRVQCKYTERYKTIKNYKIWIINLKTYTNLKKFKRYESSSFDKLFISTPDKNYLYDWSELLRHKKNIPGTLLINEIKEKNYELSY